MFAIGCSPIVISPFGIPGTIRMKSIEKSVAELASLVGGHIVGDRTLMIRRVASLSSAGADEIAYLEEEKFLQAARESKAACLITPEKLAIDLPCRIEVKNPKLAFALIAE